MEHTFHFVCVHSSYLLRLTCRSAPSFSALKPEEAAGSLGNHSTKTDPLFDREQLQFLHLSLQDLRTFRQEKNMFLSLADWERLDLMDSPLCLFDLGHLLKQPTTRIRDGLLTLHCLHQLVVGPSVSTVSSLLRLHAAPPSRAVSR